MRKSLFILTFLLLYQAYNVFALDITEYGSFSERSTIMNALNRKDNLTFEQKELLKSRKLIPSPACLMAQIKKGNIENVELLLEAKVNPNESYYTEYPIYLAAKLNNFDIVKLLFNYGAKLDRGFYSELFEAVKNKNLEMTQFLLDNNAKVNYQDSVTQNTILSYAIKNNMLDIASQLIKKGARIDTRSAILIRKKKLFSLIESK